MSEGVVLDYYDISFLNTMHPRQVCWMVAVAAGLKPSAMIESIDVDGWYRFEELLEKLGLYFAYVSGDKNVVGLPSDEIERLGGHGDVKGERAYLSFDGNDWLRMLQGESAHPDVHDNSTILPPTTYKGLDVQGVYVSKDPMQLLDLMRSRHMGQDQRWDAESAGKALGYPKCCVDSYIELGSDGLAARHGFFKELIEKGMDQKVPIEFWAIYHIPHSASCQRSIDLGRAYLVAVRSYSDGLYNSIVRKLGGSFLAYSVGERFLNYMVSSEDLYGTEIFRKEEVKEKSRKMIGSPVEVDLGCVGRPFLYVDEEYGQARLHLTRGTMGLKWIVYSPGNGVLVRDVRTEEIFLYLKADIVGDSIKFRDTVFRVYRSNPCHVGLEEP